MVVFFFVAVRGNLLAIPTWRLPVVGHALGLVTASGGVHAVMSDHGPVVLGEALKRVRLNRKLQHTLLGMVFWGFRLGQGFGRD